MGLRHKMVVQIVRVDAFSLYLNLHQNKKPFLLLENLSFLGQYKFRYQAEVLVLFRPGQVYSVIFLVVDSLSYYQLLVYYRQYSVKYKTLR